MSGPTCPVTLVVFVDSVQSHANRMSTLQAAQDDRRGEDQDATRRCLLLILS